MVRVKLLTDAMPFVSPSLPRLYSGVQTDDSSRPRLVSGCPVSVS